MSLEAEKDRQEVKEVSRHLVTMVDSESEMRRGAYGV